jgi:hypothetical protein
MRNCAQDLRRISYQPFFDCSSLSFSWMTFHREPAWTLYPSSLARNDPRGFYDAPSSQMTVELRLMRR